MSMSRLIQDGGQTRWSTCGRTLWNLGGELKKESVKKGPTDDSEGKVKKSTEPVYLHNLIREENNSPAQVEGTESYDQGDGRGVDFDHARQLFHLK